MKQFHPRQISEDAFTRIDLIVSIIVVLSLAGWLLFNLTNERGRIAKCAHNLKFLGELTQDFANEHNGCLPPASIEQPGLAWDMQIAPYLRPNQVKAGIDPFFICPSDPVNRGRPRSYAMTSHDMTPANWPPGPENQTGVGLVWSNDEIRRLLGGKATEAMTKNNFDMLALVKLSWLPAPADTVILTEFMHPDNNLKGVNRSTVSSPTEQQAVFNEKMPPVHQGKFNYLMADGHVELLSLLQTGTLDGRGGIWTISKKP